jgi:hypothetical protein
MAFGAIPSMYAPGHRAFKGFASRPGESAGRGRGYVPGWASTFEEMLITEVIPDMDSSPRTIANPRNRALAGLSRGAGRRSTSDRISTYFGSVGVFSSGLFGGVGGAPQPRAAGSTRRAVSRECCRRPPRSMRRSICSIFPWASRTRASIPLGTP